MEIEELSKDFMMVNALVRHSCRDFACIIITLHTASVFIFMVCYYVAVFFALFWNQTRIQAMKYCLDQLNPIEHSIKPVLEVAVTVASCDYTPMNFPCIT